MQASPLDLNVLLDLAIVQIDTDTCVLDRIPAKAPAVDRDHRSTAAEDAAGEGWRSLDAVVRTLLDAGVTLQTLRMSKSRPIWYCAPSLPKYTPGTI